MRKQKTLNYALVPGGGDYLWPKTKTPTMKRKAGSQSAFFNLPVLTVLVLLAGILPDSGFNGTLYRSGDGGNTWSEVPALAGTSVYDIEFAAGGNAYIGTLDSVWESSDGGLTWIAHSLGIGVNDQVLDVALDPSDPSILWAGIADASGAQPVNVMRSTDGGATWTNRTPPLGQPLSCQAI